MSEKRFTETEKNCYYTSLIFDNQTQEELGTPKVVNLLNELQNENARLSYELWRLRRIKMNLEDIKEMIINIEMLEEKDETVENVLKLLLGGD